MIYHFNSSLFCQYECCGVEWFSDWDVSGEGAIFKDKNGEIKGDYTVPNSCCAPLTGSNYTICMKSTIANNGTGVYTPGCWTKFNDEIIDENQDAILYSGIAIIVIMVRLIYLQLY